MDVETAIYCRHHWDIDCKHHGRCLLCGIERDFSPIPDPHGRDRLRHEDYEAIKKAKEEVKMTLEMPVIQEAPPPKPVEVPPRPKVMTTLDYCNANHEAMLVDLKIMKVKDFCRKWKIVDPTFYTVVRPVWVKLGWLPPIQRKVTNLNKEAADKVDTILDIVSFSFKVQLGNAGTVSLEYAGKEPYSLKESDRHFLSGILQQLLSGAGIK